MPPLGTQHFPPSHDLRETLRIERHLLRISVAVGESGRIGAGQVFIAGTHGVQQFVRNHNAIFAIHIRRRERIDHADESFGQPQ